MAHEWGLIEMMVAEALALEGVVASPAPHSLPAACDCRCSVDRMAIPPLHSQDLLETVL